MQARAGAPDLDAILRAHPSYGTVITARPLHRGPSRRRRPRGRRPVRDRRRRHGQLRAAPPAFAHELEIFEVDHPSTQQLKIERLAAYGIPLPPACTCWPPTSARRDSTTRSPARRFDASCRPSSPGSASPAISRARRTSTRSPRSPRALRPAARSSSATSTKACSSPATRMTRCSRRAPRSRRSASRGCRVSTRRACNSSCDGTGLEIVENLGPDELGARYCVGRSDGLRPSPGSHLARARVLA